MRSTFIIFISGLVIAALLADNEKYAKENVCQELRAVGTETFKEMVTVLYSQKFPNGTFEEVSCVADEMTKLAEKCCKDEASPDCYDKGATEISEMSCGKDSPFPKHPGIEHCCTLQGPERKLCLALLRTSAVELPMLLEQTNEEICENFFLDESKYSVRYAYQFARRHRNIPAGFVLNVTQQHVRMAERCCRSDDRNSCFLQDRLEMRSSTVFLRFLSHHCNNQVNLKAYRFGLSAYYGSLLGLSFEEASVLSSRIHSGLEKCCLQPQPECIIEELTSIQKILCDESKLSSMPDGLQRCCGKTALDTLPCVDELKREAKTSSDDIKLASSQLCQQAQPHATDRYLFLTGARHASIPLTVQSIIFDQLRSTAANCCSSTDGPACFTEKEQERRLKKTEALLARLDGTCSQYLGLDVPEFTALMQKEVQGKERTQAWLSWATSCCSKYSPAQLCQKLTEDVIKYEEGSAV